MKAALDSGANMWNGGELYSSPAGENSATLLEKYFAKYPEDVDKVIICIKGCVGDPAKGAIHPDGSPEESKRSVEATIQQLGGRKKKVEMFEAARLDKKTPLATQLGGLAEYVDKGLVGGISLSEVSAATIHEAVKITKIVAVEVELSMWSTDVLTNGVAAACAQYNIPLVAYSPLGRGVRLSLPSPPPFTTYLAKPMANMVADASRPLQVRRRHPRRRLPKELPALPARELRRQPPARRAGQEAGR